MELGELITDKIILIGIAIIILGVAGIISIVKKLKKLEKTLGQKIGEGHGMAIVLLGFLILLGVSIVPARMSALETIKDLEVASIYEEQGRYIDAMEIYKSHFAFNGVEDRMDAIYTLYRYELGCKVIKESGYAAAWQYFVGNDVANSKELLVKCLEAYLEELEEE